VGLEVAAAPERAALEVISADGHQGGIFYQSNGGLPTPLSGRRSF
jgi:hypothetical protein